MQPSPPASSSSTLAARSSPATTTTRRDVLFPASTSSASPSSFLAPGNPRPSRRLSEDDPVWDHSHDLEEPTAEVDTAGGDAETVLQPAVAARKRRRRRPRGPAFGSDGSDGGDSSDSRNRREWNSAGRGKVKRSPSTRHHPRSNLATLPVPSLPQPNDRFSSFVAFYQATIRAIVPIYGCGVTKSNVSSLRGGLKCQRYYQPASGAKRCPFELVVRRAAETDEYVVSTELSKYAHNHPPRAEILADPTWRPKLLNNDARAALGMSPTKWGSSKRAKKTQLKVRRADVTKARTLDGRSGGDFSDELSRLPSPDFSATASASPPQSFSSPTALPQPRPPDPLPPSHPSASHYPQPHADYSWTQFSSPRPAFPDQPVTVPSSSQYSPCPTQLGTFAPPQSSRTSYTAPLTRVHLAAFLASLHPSLAPLAPNFLTAGFSSLDSLTSLTLLEPESIEGVVELLRTTSENERTRPPGGTRIGAVQAGLLAKGLREAGSVSVA